MFRFLCGHVFHQMNKILKLKRSFFLDVELSFGLPRDRRGSSKYTTEEGIFLNQMLNQKKCIPLLGGEFKPVSRVTGHGYSSLYYRGITCLEFFVDRLSPNVVLNKILK